MMEPRIRKPVVTMLVESPRRDAVVAYVTEASNVKTLNILAYDPQVFEELKTCINRGMNTWDSAPDWLHELWDNLNGVRVGMKSEEDLS